MSGMSDKGRDALLGYNDAYRSTVHSREAYENLFRITWEPNRVISFNARSLVLISPESQTLCNVMHVSRNAIRNAMASSLVATIKLQANARAKKFSDEKGKQGPY